jgi:hypothetical protein
LSPQLTTRDEEFAEPEQEEGPEQIVVGIEHAALMIETAEELKDGGSREGEEQA